MTRQFNHLSLRNRARTVVAGRQQNQSVPSNSNNDRRRTIAVDNENNSYSRYINRLYRNAIAIRSLEQAQQQQLNNFSVQYIAQQNRGQRSNRNSNSTINSLNHSNIHIGSNLFNRSQITLPLRTSPIQLHRNHRSQIILSESIKILFDTLNQMYVCGRIPNQNSDSLINFNGVITEELANKITNWLTRSPEYQYHSIVQRCFLSSQEITSTNKVVEFLRRCGIAMETMNGITKIKREQTLDLIMIMTYLLHAAGYNNSYFVAS